MVKLHEIALTGVMVSLTLISWWVHKNKNDLIKLIDIVKKISNNATQRNAITVFLMLVIFLILAYFFKNIAAGILAAFFVFICRRKSMWLANLKRNSLIDRQAEVGLQLISSLYETKGDLIAAIKEAAGCIQPPLADELRHTVVEFSTNLSLIEALQNLAARVNSRDISVFVKGVVLSEKYGTNTAEVIKDVSSVIADRISLREEVKNEMRGQKLTIDIFLVGIPLVTVLITAFFPAAREIITDSVIGKAVIILAVIMEFMAWYLTTGQGGAENL